VKLYHGGCISIKKPEMRASSNNKDFGQGFYCTELQTQAERWSMRFHTPTITVFEFTEQSRLKVLSYEEMNDDWLNFIADCRTGTPHQYDIVIGAMANDQVWNYVADFISGVLTREQFWVLAKFKHPTHQMAFCSEKALNCLNFLESYEVSV
jgi:hypothetical protein